MITINQVSHNFGKKMLFDGINCVINAHDRIALVGANGSGKTTLLRMLMGEAEPDKGSIDKPAYASVGYLPQDGISVSGKTLYAEAESAFGDILQLQSKIEKADEDLLEMDTESEEYYELIDTIGEWEQQLENYEPAKMQSRIERILLGMGFKESDFGRDTGEFSGGWQMRIALAKLLLQRPNLLLLDEPTNHLDLKTKDILKQALMEFDGTLILVSHDRDFLDGLAKKVYEFGNRRVTEHLEDINGFLARKRIENLREIERK